MKRILIFLISLLTISAQAQTHDWENPAVLGINKLPYHATLQLPSKWKACKEIVSLDGDWQFRWSRNPEERTIDFYREDYDVSRTMATAVTCVGSKSVLRNKQYTLMVSSHSASVPGTMEKKIWREFVTRKILSEDVLSI